MIVQDSSFPPGVHFLSLHLAAEPLFTSSMTVSKPLLSSLTGGLLFFCFARLNLSGTGNEGNFHRYVLPITAGIAAGLLIGRWRKRNNMLLAEKNDLVASLQAEIHHRKKTANALAQSEEQIRLLLRHTAEGIFGLDCGGRCIFCNPSLLQMLGYDDEKELLGQKIHTIIHHSRVDNSPYPVDECKAHSGYAEGERIHVDDEVFWKKDGTPLHIEYWSHPVLKDNSITGAVVTAIDISKRWMALHALQESEERYRSLVDTAHDAIVSIDQSGKIIFWNTSAERIFGFCKEEIINHPVETIIHEQFRDRHTRALARMLDASDLKEDEQRLEITALKKDGNKLQVELSLSCWSQGGVAGFTSVIRDISQRKAAEKEKNQLTEQLTHAQKMESIGRLAGGVAHDFNNILSAINGYAEICLMRMEEDNPFLKEMKIILESGQRAARLTQQLLAFSRKQIIQPELLHLNREIANIIKMLTRLLGEHIEIRTNLDDRLWPVWADRGQLEQVILNLAINARDAMPSGGQLTIETFNVILDESYQQAHSTSGSGEYVMIAISDNGTGMDKELKKHIFEPFFTTKEAGTGTGLGLAMVYGIIKQNNGETQVYSEPGTGTSFKIYLPRAKKAANEQKKTGQREEWTDNGGTETILLAEDDPAVRTMSVDILTTLGYTVLEAENGEAALRAHAHFHGKIDLLLTDVIMPKMSGPELAAEIQHHSPGSKILFMSGYTEDTIVVHGILKKDINFTHKPITPASLSRAVRKVLDSPQ